MNRKWLAVLAVFGAGQTLAQDSDVSVSVGVRAWSTQWTTFDYITDPNNPKVNLGLNQSTASNKLVLMPSVSVRYGDFSGSVSAMPSTGFSFVTDSSAARQEFDINLGYDLLPGLRPTLGYKKVSQSGNAGRYRPSGPVVGVGANAPLADTWSLYGSLGIGWLKTPAGDEINFKTDYRLTEVGLAYTLGGTQIPRRWVFTAGYRSQVMGSKNAFQAQDGRDTTQGFTLGVIATF